MSYELRTWVIHICSSKYPRSPVFSFLHLRVIQIDFSRNFVESITLSPISNTKHVHKCKLFQKVRIHSDCIFYLILRGKLITNHRVWSTFIWQIKVENVYRDMTKVHLIIQLILYYTYILLYFKFGKINMCVFTK